MFILATRITDPKRKRVLLLYQAGSRVREIFKQLVDTGDDDDYNAAKAKLKGHFEPQRNWHTKYIVLDKLDKKAMKH